MANLVLALLGASFALLATSTDLLCHPHPDPSAASNPPEEMCSALCRISTTGDFTMTNPGGGTMTVEFVDMSPGICGCETPPCKQLGDNACKGSIRFSYDSHVSWRTWVPHVTDGGKETPVCPQPASGSDQPPAETIPMKEGCGNSLELKIEYWKKRLDATDRDDVTPDRLVKIACSSCNVNNCN
jgi:hypothetical protein